MAQKNMGSRKNGVREILLTGIFRRIVFIEGVLLVFSLAYKWATQGADAMELFLYGLRIIILVAIIIAFMMISLKKFLTRKIIAPLETIARKNRELVNNISAVRPVKIPDDAPHEIKSIVESRQKMLETIIDESEKRLQLVNFVRETFGRYLSSRVVDEILESPEGSKIGGRRKTVTILMADLRGFTSISESRDPGEMVHLLNQYFEKMSEIILKYDGIIDEFIGDAILAVFGAPTAHDDDPARAVACAIEMQNSLGRLNEQIGRSGFAPLEMGIGINTGKVIVGNIGSKLRMKYGIVGAAVNTAARIESNTTGGQVFIGEPTFMQVRDIVTAGRPGTKMMKGLRKPLVFYPVSAINYRADLRLNPGTSQKDTFAISLPFEYRIINNKQINANAGTGETIYLNSDTIDAAMSPMPEPFTDIRLTFDFCVQAHCFKDVYAKTIPVKEKDKITRLKITFMDQDDRRIIQTWAKDCQA